MNSKLNDALIDCAVAALSGYTGASAFGAASAGVVLIGKIVKSILNQREDSLDNLITKCIEAVKVPEEYWQWCKAETILFFKSDWLSADSLIGNQDPVSDYIAKWSRTLNDTEKNWLASVLQYAWDSLSEGIRKTPDYQLALENLVKKQDKCLTNLENRSLRLDTSNSVNEENLKRQCVALFQKIVQEHPSMKLVRKIDSEPVMFPLQGCNEEGYSFSLYNLCSYGPHLILLGKGGTGKSLTLLSSCTENMLPIYIPLHSVLLEDKNSPIRNYIRMQVLYENAAHYEAFLRMAASGPPRILLLLDGLNEVPYISIGKVDQGDIIHEINTLYHMAGIQMILSSRTNILSEHSDLLGNWKTIHLEQLSEEVIRAYLVQAGVSYPKQQAAEELLSNPLMLSLYTISGDIKTKYPDAKYDWKEQTNSACLIWNYFQYELLHFEIGNKGEDYLLCVVATEIITPYIAWQMEKNNVFAMNKESFLIIMYDAANFVKILKKHRALRTHIHIIMMYPDNMEITEKRIFTLLTEDLHLFSFNQDGMVELLHQNFRDCLAAIHMCNLAYLAQHTNDYPDEWKDSVDPFVMDYIAELAEADVYIRRALDVLWEMNRKTHPTNVNMTYTLLEFQKRLLKYDFSQLNWSGMDISNMSLYNYHVPGNACLLLPKNRNFLKGTKVSERTFTMEGHTDFVICSAMSADERILASGDFDGRICIWNLDYSVLLHTIETGCTISCIAITEDGHKTVCGTRKGIVYVYETFTGELLFEINEHKDEVFDCFLSDGTLICASCEDHLISVHDINSGTRLPALNGAFARLTYINLSNDKKLILSGYEDGKVRIWNVQSGCCICEFSSQPMVTCIACFENKDFIAVGSKDGIIKIWNINKNPCDCVKTLDMKTPECVESICILDENKLVCRLSSYIQIQDLDDPFHIYTQELPTVYAYNFILPLDKSTFLTNSKCVLYLWNLNSKSIVKTFVGHQSEISSCIVFSNGRKMLTTSFDNDIRVWNISTGKCLHIFSSSGSNYNCAKSNIEFLPDLNLVAWNEWDELKNSSIEIFNLETGNHLCTVSVSERDLSISHYNHRLLVNEGKKIKEWDIDSQSWCNEIIYDGQQKNVYPLIDRIAVSADGNVILFITSIQGQAVVYTKARGIQELELLSDRIIATAAAPDGSSVCALEENCGLHIWSGENLDVKHTISMDIWYDHDAIYTPDSKRILFACKNGLFLYAVDTGKVSPIFQENDMYLDHLSISSDCEMFAAGDFSSGLIRIYDINTCICLAEFKNPFPESGFIKTSFSKDGKYLYVACEMKNRIFRWEIMSGKSNVLYLLPEIDVRNVDFSESIRLKKNGRVYPLLCH